MDIALYPRKENLVIGIVIGVAIALAGRWASQSGFSGDSSEFWGYAGIAAVIGGLFVIGDCALRLVNPRPVFAADAEGFSVMGKRKQPWGRFHGVGVWQMKQYGITTGSSVYVKVGKTPTFSRKRHIKWTHLSAGAPVMAQQIADFAARRRAAAVAADRAGAIFDDLIGAEDGGRGDAAKPDNPAAPTQSPKAEPVAAAFADGPIQSPRRGLFGR